MDDAFSLTSIDDIIESLPYMHLPALIELQVICTDNYPGPLAEPETLAHLFRCEELDDILRSESQYPNLKTLSLICTAKATDFSARWIDPVFGCMPYCQARGIRLQVLNEGM